MCFDKIASQAKPPNYSMKVSALKSESKSAVLTLYLLGFHSILIFLEWPTPIIYIFFKKLKGS